MRWKVCLAAFLATARRKRHQVGKLAGCEPRETAAIIHPPECKASIALDPVPAEVRGPEFLAAHGLHGIAEDPSTRPISIARSLPFIPTDGRVFDYVVTRI